MARNPQNIPLIEHLREIAHIYTNQGHIYQARPFDQAATYISGFDNPVTKEDLSEIREQRGIGTGTISTIKQFLETENSDKLQQLESISTKSAKSKAEILQLLQNVPQIGKVRAQKYYDAGVRSLHDLLNQPNLPKQSRKYLEETFRKPIQKSGQQQKLSRKERMELFQTVDGIGPKTAEYYVDLGIKNLEELRKVPGLSKRSKLYLEYYDDLQQKIPRNEIDQIDDVLAVLWEPFDIRYQIAGSYRRGLPESSDIDVLVEDKNLYQLMEQSDNDQLVNANHLKQLIEYLNGTVNGENFIIGTLSQGRDVANLIIRSPRGLARRMDVHGTVPNEWGTALLYFTGSKQFNIRMRDYAKVLGYRLNRDNIKDLDTDELFFFPTEQEVFNFLALKYISPQDRTDNVPLINLEGVNVRY